MKEKELSELRSTTAAEIEELTKRYQRQIEEKAKHIEEANTNISQKSLLLSKLENDIVELKSILANKDQEIKTLTEKTLGNKYIQFNSNNPNTHLTFFYIIELQNTLTMSEQSKTDLENQLRVFESNIEQLNQQVAGTENKLSQVTVQKEKLVSNCYTYTIFEIKYLIFCTVFRRLILQI